MEQKKKYSSIELSSNFSIQQFIEIFSGIDEQIFQLHQCSSDDFLGLNSDFKHYFKQSKLISDNASQIFNELAKSESAGLLREIETFYKEIKHIQSAFSNLLDNSIKQLSQILSLLDKLYLPVKNLNQDLLTLKILLTNLKIFSSANPSSANSLDEIVQKFNRVINDFKTYSFQNESNLEQLKEHVMATYTKFETIRNSSVKDLDLILNNVHMGIILFAEKHEEVSRLIPQLSKQTENSSKSIADIITNLQYHDIIRQKMEHVHATHKKLLAELDDTAKTKEKDSLDNTDILLLKIRDIANLQSAQLVYANKEYQSAIEVITDKFMNIGNNMTIIASMCHEIYLSQDNSNEFHMQGFITRLKSSASVLNRFLSATNDYTLHIDQLFAQVGHATKSVTVFSNSIVNLKDVFTSTHKAFSETDLNDKKLGESLKHIQNLYKDVEGFEEIIKDGFSKVELIANQFLPENSKTLAQAKITGMFAQSADSMNSIIEKLNDKNAKIDSLLSKSISISKTILKDINESIGKVKYYDFFEKVIVDIIGEFNHIHRLLKTEVNFKNEEDLEDVRKSYTMASEHKIHNQVIKGLDEEGVVDLFDEDIDTDDDNLELF
ncbi:MAG: hypothetical protein PHD06_04715 [Bacteroidales bacterium]|nr:hypothetical protein [Bacteroidales bacterium]MDD4384461.1 hypothetical protein [Bacteroidales bacterium]MDY0196814.1 hypothetical protein [Tenuifilaceae bacterium]